MNSAYVGGVAFVVGACIGSFLNVCVARWPADQSVVRPRSRCPGCGQAIAWYDNIPIVSWLLLRARCRSCGTGISAQYPAVELAVALGWLATFLAFGVTFTALRIAVFGTVMFGIAVTDLKHYLIPDGFTVFGLLFVLAAAMLGYLMMDPSPFAGPWEALLGACTGAGAIAIVGWLGEAMLKREAMGFGDVTLMAVVGAAVGPTRSLLVIFIGAALGAVTYVLVVLPAVRWRRGAVVVPAAPPPADDHVGDRRDMPNVPFGVFLAPAAMLMLLAGDWLIAWYFGRAVGS